MRIWSNRRGNCFMSGLGGTYPVNDGDPQNDVEFDEPEDTEDDNEVESKDKV